LEESKDGIEPKHHDDQDERSQYSKEEAFHTGASSAGNFAVVDSRRFGLGVEKHIARPQGILRARGFRLRVQVVL
jgi:hypothetical protein